MRRSSRPRIRPLEFWNFETADYSASQEISYKLSGSTLNSTKIKNKKGTDNHSKPDGSSSEIGKTDNGKRKKQLEKDEEDASKFNIKLPIVVIKKLKTQQNIREAQSKNRADTESNDSGITDLDITNAPSVASDTKQLDTPADISSIHVESTSFMSALNLYPTNTQKKSGPKEDSKARKSFTFQNAFSSTTVSEENVDGCFKVPLLRHKMLKKSFAVEPVLGSIVEEREEKSMEYDELTPKKTCALSRSRVLSFDCDADAVPERRKVIDAEGDDIDVSQQETTEAMSDKATTIVSTSCKSITSVTKLKTVRSGDKNNREPHKKINTNTKSDATVSTVSKVNRRQRNHSSKKQKEEGKSNNDAKALDKRGGKKTNFITTDLSIQQSICSNAEVTRRSGRVRKKPLEFWNFETAEVKKLTNGEVSLVYTKRIDPSSVFSTVKKRVSLHPALEENNIHPSTKKTSVGLSSPMKRKLFSPETDKLDSPVEQHQSPVLRRRNSMGRICTCNSEEPPDFTEFKSLQFCERETEEFKCFMARNYCDIENQIYSGFLFLARGKMMWVTNKITTLFVICGEGTLKLLHSPTEGEEIVLKEKVKTTIPIGKKVVLKISNGSDMLRLFVALQKGTSAMSS